MRTAPVVLASLAAEAYRRGCHVTTVESYPTPPTIVAWSSLRSSKPLLSHREGSGGRVIERTQERTTGAAGADLDGAETRGLRASNRSHRGGEGDLLTFALGVTYRFNAENHFWGLEG